MAKQDVNFRQGGPINGDSGERGDDPLIGFVSIKPSVDGERAVAANFDRPTDNLRKRTEVLRVETEDQKYLQDGDMKWILGSGKADGTHDPTTLWPVIGVWREHPVHLGQWYFSLLAGTSLVVQPLNTVRADVQETKFWEFPNPAPVPTSGVNITNLRRSYSGANVREVVWEALPPAEIVGTHGLFQWFDMTLSGEDDHILTLTIRDDGLTQLANISAAFAAWNLAYLNPAGFSGACVGTLTNTVAMADIPVEDVDYIFEGTFEREMHYFPKAMFDAFFLDVNNLMQDGDTLSVMFDFMVDPNPLTTTGRRQAIASNGNTEPLPTQLFLTRNHPEWIPLAIPLCKRIKQELVWLDGTICTEAHASLWGQRFGENGFTIKRIYDAFVTVPITMSSAWFDELPGSQPWVTVQAALDGIVADLAGTQDAGVNPVLPGFGADLIGMHTVVTAHQSLGFYDIPALPAHSIGMAFDNILPLLNNKGSLGLDEDVPGNTFGWRVTNRWRFGENAVELRDAHAAHGLRLIYRNNGVLPAGPIDFNTLSIYEGSGTIPPNVRTRLMLWGATIDGAGNVTAAPGGPGDVSLISWQPGYIIAATRVAVAGGTTWNGADPTQWSTFDTTDLDNRNIYAHTHFYRQTAFNSSIKYDVTDAETAADAEDEVIFKTVTGSVYAGRYRHRYMDPSAVEYRENRVIEGLYPMGSNTISSPPTADSFLITSGAAIVGGREIVFKSGATYTDAHTRFTSELSLYVNTNLTNGWKFPCFWVYVWLRKDGEIILDHLGPAAFAGSGYKRDVWTRTNRWWSPRFNTGVFKDNDYCLLGVMYPYKGEEVSPGIWRPYFGGVRPVGGNLWRFDTTLYDVGVAIVHAMDSIFLNPGGVNPDTAYQTSRTDVNNDVDTYVRTPGIPMSITSKGLVNYQMELAYAAAPPNPEYIQYNIMHPELSGLYHVDVSGIALSQLDVRASDGEMITYPWPLTQKFKVFNGQLPIEAYPIRDFYDTLPAKRWLGLIRSRAFVFAGASPTSGYMVANGILNLMGFYWDRDNCQNQLHFVI